MMNDIKIACPYCRQRIAVPADMFGQSAECPACGKPIQLPSAPQPAEAPRAELKADAPVSAPLAQNGFFVKKTTAYALLGVAAVLFAASLVAGYYVLRSRTLHAERPGTTISGSVSISGSDGVRISPRTRVFLAPADSPAAGEVLQLFKSVQACAKKSDQLDVLESRWTSQDSSDRKNVSNLLADKKTCSDALHTLWMDVLRRESELIPKTTDLPHTKTNTDGKFALADIRPGRYVLYARTHTEDQQVFWAKEILKKDALLVVAFDNDNAAFIRK